MEIERRAQAGFTMIEALVSLVVASVMFAVLFQIAARATERSARLSERAQALGEAVLNEKLYRTVLLHLSPPLQEENAPPPDQVFRGNSQRIDGWVSSDMEAACMGLSAYQPISLTIEQEGREGRLVCVSDGGEYPLAAWSGGPARFDYSIDGRTWIDEWPVQSAALAPLEAPQAADPFSVEVRKTLTAPLVRLTMPGARRKVWIERAGQTQLQPLPRREFLFTQGGGTGRQFEVETP